MDGSRGTGKFLFVETEMAMFDWSSHQGHDFRTLRHAYVLKARPTS